jgi:hypothetical protein
MFIGEEEVLSPLELVKDLTVIRKTLLQHTCGGMLDIRRPKS